jgi:hypothetical protein
MKTCIIVLIVAFAASALKAEMKPTWGKNLAEKMSKSCE